LKGEQLEKGGVANFCFPTKLSTGNGRFHNGVARFFLVQYTKTGKYTKGSLNMPKKINNVPNIHKIDQNFLRQGFQNI
jgi:activator of 2-hydroxyglutaryl-CoA dehydratase